MKQRIRDQNLGERSQRAEMHFNRGMYASARDEYVSLLEDARELSPERQAEIRGRLGISLASLGETAESDRTIARALEIEGVSEEQRLRLEAVKGYSALVRGEVEEARNLEAAVIERMRERGHRAGLCTALRWHAMACLRLGELETAFESAYCSLAETRHEGLEVEACHAHGVLCVAFIQQARYDSAIDHGERALSIATRLGHQSGTTRNNLHLSVASRLAGQLERATRYGLRALAAAEESGASNLAISARLATGRALRDSGRLAQAREMAEAALLIVRGSERDRDHVLVLEDLGDLDWLAGNTRAALEKHRLAWQIAEKIAAEGDLVAELGWRIGASLLELGDAEGAARWIERSLTVADKAGERREHALALRARGRLRAHTGRDAESRQDFEASLAALEPLGVPYDRAYTHLVAADALRVSAGDSPGAREERRRHLATAHRLFERIGAEHGIHACEQAEIALAAEETDANAAPPSMPRAAGRPARAIAADWPSSSFVEMLEECRKLGPTSLPILLVGETGTGKTLLAEALHSLGRREEGEFFPVNCAALPPLLQESELFGHRKGSFTGADRDHPGIFREAGRGTVFLDEIDKTSLEFQAKLLHVLDNREIRPVGSTRRLAVEARIVCATNRNLFGLVEKGEFLDDLHHRLTCGIIQVPALRERVEDLRLLSQRILREICELERTAVPEITEDAWRLLTAHSWPGNVRELKSLLHRAVALNRDLKRMDAACFVKSAPVGSKLRDLDGRLADTSADDRLTKRMENAEREEILRALELAGGVRKKAAETLGVSYRGLGKKMVRLGIEGPRRKK